MLKQNQNSLSPDQVEAIYAEKAPIKRGEMLKRNFRELLLADPKQLKEQLSACINTLLSYKTTQSIVNDLIELLFNTNDVYPPLFHLDMQIYCLNSIWSALKPFPELQQIVVYKLWHCLLPYPEATKTLFVRTPLLSTLPMLDILTGHLNKKPDQALRLLQQVETPIYKTPLLRFDTLRDELFGNLLKLYQQSNNPEILSAVLTLIIHGCTPRAQRYAEWLEVLETHIRQNFVTEKHTTLYKVMIELLTAGAPQRQERVALVVTKLLVLNKEHMDIAQALLSRLLNLCPRAVFPTLVSSEKQGLLQREQLFSLYATLPNHLQQQYDDRIIPLIKQATHSHDASENTAALTLISQLVLQRTGSTESLLGEQWNAQSVILLEHANGQKQVDIIDAEAKLQFDFTAWFQSNTQSAITETIVSTDSLSLRELLQGLYHSRTMGEGMPYIMRLYQLGLTGPCEQLITSALSTKSLSHANAKSLFELLLQLHEFKIDDKDLVRLIAPLYLNPEASNDELFQIERLLFDNHVQKLSPVILEKCLQRLPLKENATLTLLASLDLTDTVHTLAQQLRSSEEKLSQRATEILNALPLATLFTAIIKIPNNQLSADMMKILIQRINKTTNNTQLERLFHTLPLVQLLELYQQQKALLAQDKVILLKTILKDKLERAPVHDNQLITQTSRIRLPKELELPNASAPIEAHQLSGTEAVTNLAK